MNCPKCGNTLAPNTKFCAKCGTPVAQQMPPRPAQPMPVQQNIIIQKPAQPKLKKKNNTLPLAIVAIVLVIAVIASSIAVVPKVIKNNTEINNATEYIEDFPTLKQQTQFLVYDAEKFPSEKYEIKVERMLMGGIFNGAFKGETVLKDVSTERVYDLDFKEDGNYRITLTDITAERTQATSEQTEISGLPSENSAEVIEIIIIIDVVVDNDAEDAADKVDINSDVLDEMPKTPMEALEGTYKGSYFPGQGETGLTLTVFKQEGEYKALFDFYNLPGRTNSKSGKYYMTVVYNEETETYSFKGSEWIDKPSSYVFVALEGKLDGDILSGEGPTKFSVTRVDETDHSDETAEEETTTTTTTATTTTTTTTTTQPTNPFSIIPSEFDFSSGAGAWGSTLTINSDGSFAGYYSDTNAGSSDPQAVNGERYECHFNGRFSQPVKINEYAYEMRVARMETAEPEGKEYFEDGMKIICTGPCGLENAGEVRVYLPGAPVAELPVEVTDWCYPILNGRSTIPQGIYILYSVEDMAPYVGRR